METSKYSKMVSVQGFSAQAAHQNCLTVFNNPHAQTALLNGYPRTSRSGVWAPVAVKTPQVIPGYPVENHFVHVAEIWGK